MSYLLAKPLTLGLSSPIELTRVWAALANTPFPGAWERVEVAELR